MKKSSANLAMYVSLIFIMFIGPIDQVEGHEAEINQSNVEKNMGFSSQDDSQHQRKLPRLHYHKPKITPYPTPQPTALPTIEAAEHDWWQYPGKGKRGKKHGEWSATHHDLWYPAKRTGKYEGYSNGGWWYPNEGKGKSNWHGIEEDWWWYPDKNKKPTPYPTPNPTTGRPTAHPTITTKHDWWSPEKAKGKRYFDGWPGTHSNNWWYFKKGKGKKYVEWSATHNDWWHPGKLEGKDKGYWNYWYGRYDWWWYPGKDKKATVDPTPSPTSHPTAHPTIDASEHAWWYPGKVKKGKKYGDWSTSHHDWWIPGKRAGKNNGYSDGGWWYPKEGKGKGKGYRDTWYDIEEDWWLYPGKDKKTTLHPTPNPTAYPTTHPTIESTEHDWWWRSGKDKKPTAQPTIEPTKDDLWYQGKGKGKGA